jgi:protein tyrosine/serine phosphatase
MRRVAFWVSLLLLGGCAYLGYLSDPFSDIPSFYQVDDVLWRGGQPNQEGFKKLKSLEIKTVISLRGQNNELIWEKRLVEALGMNFYNLPMSIYTQPSQEMVLKFLEIVLNKENQPVFLHCESGRDRTGAMIALYRVTVYSWTPKQAYQEAKRFGFWPYHGKAELKKFILQLKDKKIYFEKVKELLYEEKK